MRRITLAALAATAATCAAAGPARAESGHLYNQPFGTSDVSDCIYPSGSSTVGSFAFSNAALPSVSFARWPGCEHAPGSMRVLKIQRLTIGGRLAYMSRGGLASGDSWPGDPHVHIAASSLARQPDLVAHSLRNGNGRAASGCTGRFFVKPTSVPGDMLYKINDGGGAAWDNYGNPGARFGSSWTHAVWNIPVRAVPSGTWTYYYENSPGGYIQSTLRHRQEAFNCTGVDHQFLPSYAPNTMTRNGTTEWAYARYSNGSETLYGWIMVAFWKTGQPKTLMFEWV